MFPPLIPRSRERLGSAMFTAVMSRITINWAIKRMGRSKRVDDVAGLMDALCPCPCPCRRASWLMCLITAVISGFLSEGIRWMGSRSHPGGCGEMRLVRGLGVAGHTLEPTGSDLGGRQAFRSAYRSDDVADRPAGCGRVGSVGEQRVVGGATD